MSPSDEINSEYIKSAPCCLHNLRKGGSLTSSIGARSNGKSGSSILPIFIKGNFFAKILKIFDRWLMNTYFEYYEI
jgi:hypothetical protein